MTGKKKGPFSDFHTRDLFHFVCLPVTCVDTRTHELTFVPYFIDLRGTYDLHPGDSEERDPVLHDVSPEIRGLYSPFL